MRRREGDLILVTALAALCALLCAVIPESAEAVRVLPAALLVLVLPGYALTAALLAPALLTRAERVLLAIALSMVASVITALVLNVAWQLDTTPWAVGLAVATALAAAVGVRRGHGREVAWQPIPAIGAGPLLALLGAIALACGAFALGVTPLRAPDDIEGSTALWISPRGTDAVTIGARSGELGPRTYALDIRVAGQRARRVGPFVLEPGEQRRIVVPARPSVVGQPIVEALLRRVDAPSEDVRRVALRAGRRSLQPPAVKPAPCPRSHPHRSLNGCYRVVLRGKRKLRFYTDGRRVAAR